MGGHESRMHEPYGSGVRWSEPSHSSFFDFLHFHNNGGGMNGVHPPLFPPFDGIPHVVSPPDRFGGPQARGSHEYIYKVPITEKGYSEYGHLLLHDLPPDLMHASPILLQLYADLVKRRLAYAEAFPQYHLKPEQMRFMWQGVAPTPELQKRVLRDLNDHIVPRSDDDPGWHPQGVPSRSPPPPPEERLPPRVYPQPPPP
jgi:hypothetical protein